MLLLARTTPREEVTKPTDGLSVFLIDLRELKDNGVEIRPIDTMINHNTTEVFFSDAKIPAASLVGEEGKGFRYILDGMNAERTLIASESIGDARFFLERASSYACERKIFGGPIGRNQGIQFPLARAHAETEAAELMARKAAALFDDGQPCGPEANMAKLLCAEAAWHAGEACMQTFGGFAFAREYDIERKWREARLYLTAPISTNLVLAYIGQHVLGLPKSY
jgi:acyl-CoA dehydrogenase